MGKQTIEQISERVIAALDGIDHTTDELTRCTQLDGVEAKQIERAVNYLKGQRRIENQKGYLHLRPETPTPDPTVLVVAHDQEMHEAAIQGYEEAWHQDIQPPAEPALESDEPFVPAEPETIVIDGWTCYLTYADLLPPLTPEEYDALKADIQEHGMLVPLLLSQTGQDRHYHVLDGQHRLRIAKELGIGWMQIPKNYRNLLTDEQREELALNLNLHRRHLTPEQRQQYAVKMRGQGDSLRAIGQRLGVDHKTVSNDLAKAAAAGEFSPAETVTGLDGKSYPATKPDPTPIQAAADKIYAIFAGMTAGLEALSKRCGAERIDASTSIKALGLLEASGQATPVKGYPGTYQFKALPELESDMMNNTFVNNTVIAPMEPARAATNTPESPTPASAEPPTVPQESAELPAKSEPPALPAGVTFAPLGTLAHSDDHDADLAAALLIRLELDKALLDVLDALKVLNRRWGIRGLARLDREKLDDLNRRLGEVHGQLRGAMNTVDELNQKVVTMINTGQLYDEVQA